MGEFDLKRLLRCMLGGVLLLLVPTRGSSQSCPDVDPADGYPVVAHSEAVADSAWLAGVARAVAYRWQVPSRRRNAYVGWERVQRRVLPPEPRWADDWRPEPEHRAVLRLTLLRGAGAQRLELVEASGDRTFDRSLDGILARPMPDAPPFPEVPPADEAAVVVEIRLGHPPAPGAATVRFAAVQTRIELVANSLRVLPPAGHRGAFPDLTVKYDVRADGTVDPTSFEFVRSPGRAFEEVVRRGILAARFRAPTSNCRPVAQSVVQTFGL